MIEWWKNPRIPMSPVNRLRASWIIIVISVIGWPLSAFTVAAQEPPWILALSWGAVIITALDVVSTTDVGADVDDQKE